jgi:hypothetical protein
MQSGVPTKVFLSLPGGAMQSNGGEILVGADVSKAWIDVCQSETTRVDRIANTPEALELVNVASAAAKTAVGSGTKSKPKLRPPIC